MLPELAQQAIEEALKGNWNGAVALNKELLSQNPKNTEALNRLARAYLELGRAADAKTYYKRVLRIDKYNTIAQKALERLSNIKRLKKTKKDGEITALPTTGDTFIPKEQTSFMPQAQTSFIEEPGRTKTVTLIHLGDRSVLTNLDAGDSVLLRPQRHRVSVETQDNRYIGRIPDDLSRRLIKFIQSGNEYTGIVRAGNTDSVRIFIREIKRSGQLKDTPSFPIEKNNYSAFTPPESIHADKPEIQKYEEEF